ncbi:hypothetical protein NN561_009101 [Cricetulus griseus]
MPSWTSAPWFVHAREQLLNPTVQCPFQRRGIAVLRVPPLTGVLRATPWLAQRSFRTRSAALRPLYSVQRSLYTEPAWRSLMFNSGRNLAASAGRLRAEQRRRTSVSAR